MFVVRFLSGSVSTETIRREPTSDEKSTWRLYPGCIAINFDPELAWEVEEDGFGFRGLLGFSYRLSLEFHTLGARRCTRWIEVVVCRSEIVCKTTKAILLFSLSFLQLVIAEGEDGDEFINLVCDDAAPCLRQLCSSVGGAE